jgi:hypothetical protein
MSIDKAVPAGPIAMRRDDPDVPHTFDVVSEDARFLLITQPAGFEGFIRAVSEPTTELTLPPADGPAPDPARLAAVAAEFGIEVLGPPGIPEA